MITYSIQTNDISVILKEKIDLCSETSCSQCVYNSGVKYYGKDDYFTARCILYEKIKKQFPNYFYNWEMNIIDNYSKCIVYKKIIEISKGEETK